MVFKSLIFLGLLYFITTTNSLSLQNMDLHHHKHVINECAYTTYPSICINVLKNSREDRRHRDLIYVLMNETVLATNLYVSNMETLGVGGGGDFISNEEAQITRKSIGYCYEMMKLSLKRLNQAQIDLIKSPTKNKQDIQTWLSAVITFQETCKDIVDQHSASNEHMDQVSKKMVYLSKLGSNLLALVNRITVTRQRTVNVTSKGGHGFPEWVPGKERKLLQSDTINANVVVAKDGSGHYRTISEAIQAANTGRRFVIYVKAGVYQEKIHCKKDYITLIGEGKYNTIITGASSVAKGYPLEGTATFTIIGDGFIAKDIGFQNTAGPNAEQAIAITVASDHAVLYRCAVMGYQDTLYAHSLRQFYRECDIHGTIDFIFGNAAAVFQNCIISLRRPSEGAYNVILANSRTDGGQSTGFSLHNCKITVDSDFYPVKKSIDSYIGRPWKSHSRAVVMQSFIDDAISPRGWVEWPVNPSSSLGTLYFAEYGNKGPGALISGRVKWHSYHVIGRDEAIWYTVGNFIGGWSWLPSTGVTFFSGLQ